MAAATSVAFAALLTLSAQAEADVFVEDKEILGEDEGWGLEDFRFSFAYLRQVGRGLQSKATPDRNQRGVEDIMVIEPILYALIRQTRSVRHQIYVPVDIVSSASTNALDAISQASAVTEAADLDITTIVDLSDDARFNVHYGVHWEEPMTALYFGGGVGFDMAEDNATLGFDVLGIVDMFDTIMPDGRDVGLGIKWTGSANVSFSQLLSPTTVAWLSYGLTFQQGVLETTYNSVPIEGSNERTHEIFPGRRLRHAVAARIAQNIPATRTTLRGGYRFYIDDIDVDAHTADFQIYQYLGPSWLLEGSYRFHTQTAPSFFAESVTAGIAEDAPRTADSDLADFDAHEVGAKLLYLFNPTESTFVSSEHFNLRYSRYWRPNLTIDSFTMTYAFRF